MAIDVVKWDNPGRTLAWKFPRADLSTLTQLIVNQSQWAVLFKDGRRMDVFGPGRHTLSSNNIPILNKLINLPFAGQSPFAAEVWFLNRTIPLNLKFGTPNPIHVEDPVYGIIVPVRAFGQFGLEILDPGLFLQMLVGANHYLDHSEVVELFKGVIVSKLKARIAKTIVREQIGILEVETQIDELSKQLEVGFAPDFGEYGLAVRNFKLMSINVSETDPSVMELKRAKAAVARRRIEGTSYIQERSFDTFERAAANSGVGGSFAAAGLGLEIGRMMGQHVQGLMPPPLPPPAPANPHGKQLVEPTLFHIHLDGGPMGPYQIEELRQGVVSGRVSWHTPVWRPGWPSWIPAGSVPELTMLFETPPPTVGATEGATTTVRER